MVQLWAHECERIYGDRLVSPDHLKQYKAFASDMAKKAFPRTNLSKFYQEVNPDPLIFANFVASLDDKLYDRFPSMDAMSAKLHEALRDYNDTNAVMDLVLFEDAMKHCCKISRIVSNDGGHALLVGVGGSGKQSLSRLSAAICMFQTMTIVISSTYGLADLKVDLQKMYLKSGQKDEGIMFLFTEGQITNERFLVFINDLLSSGEIADLFPVEDVDNIVNAVRSAVKGEGIIDNKDNCWKFFLDRVRKNLHMSLCFSPVGDAFRNRAKKFPALVNSTVIDWFHPWPQEALLSVAAKFLEETEMPSEEVRDAINKFMPFSFTVVNEFSDAIREVERRFVYTTPKSFLELVKLFKNMLGKKAGYLEEEKTKFEIGVGKLKDTEEAVAVIEQELQVKSVEVEQLKKEANEQATVVGAEKEIVDAKAAEAGIESAKANKIADEVATLLASVQADLDAAGPLVEQAKAALAGL
jgi:dynein heavy chain